MRRRGGRSELQVGNDSFLDIVANIVGILIILIVVAGVRVSRAPVTEGSEVVESSTTELELVDPPPVIDRSDDVARLSQDVTRLEQEVATELEQLEALSRSMNETQRRQRERETRLNREVVSLEALVTSVRSAEETVGGLTRQRTQLRRHSNTS